MKDFEEVLNSIPNEVLAKLELERKKDKFIGKIEFLLLLLFLLATGINFYIGKMVILFEIALLFGLYYLSRRLPIAKFKECYEKEIIKPIVEAFDGIVYDTEKGISEEEYKDAEYSSGDEYYTGNYFANENETIRVSDISILDKTTDEEGNTKYRTVFDGIFAIITLNNFSKEVITMPLNANIVNLILHNKDKIEVDSAEFEKDFDLYCENRVYAMEVFTSDLLRKIIELGENDNTKFDIKLKENKLYVRYYKTDIFKINVNKAMQEESMKKIYDNVYQLLDLLTKLQKNIDKKLGEVN